MNEYITKIWKIEINREYEDIIKYVDGRKHQIPRAEEDIQEINNQIDFYGRSLGGEFIEILKDKEIVSLYEILRNEDVLKIRHGLFSKYRMRFRVYVKREFSS